MHCVERNGGPTLLSTNLAVSEILAQDIITVSTVKVVVVVMTTWFFVIAVPAEVLRPTFWYFEVLVGPAIW